MDSIQNTLHPSFLKFCMRYIPFDPNYDIFGVGMWQTSKINLFRGFVSNKANIIYYWKNFNLISNLIIAILEKFLHPIIKYFLLSLKIGITRWEGTLVLPVQLLGENYILSCPSNLYINSTSFISARTLFDSMVKVAICKLYIILLAGIQWVNWIGNCAWPTSDF